MKSEKHLLLKVRASLDVGSTTNYEMTEPEHVPNVRDMFKHLVGLEKTIKVSIGGKDYPFNMFIESVDEIVRITREGGT